MVRFVCHGLFASSLCAFKKICRANGVPNMLYMFLHSACVQIFSQFTACIYVKFLLKLAQKSFMFCFIGCGSSPTKSAWPLPALQLHRALRSSRYNRNRFLTHKSPPSRRPFAFYALFYPTPTDWPIAPPRRYKAQNQAPNHPFAPNMPIMDRFCKDFIICC